MNPMVEDVVCGMEVDPESVPPKAEYNGETYYFCSEFCQEQFEKHPEQFVEAA